MKQADLKKLKKKLKKHLKDLHKLFPIAQKHALLGGLLSLGLLSNIALGLAPDDQAWERGRQAEHRLGATQQKPDRPIVSMWPNRTPSYSRRAPSKISLPSRLDPKTLLLRARPRTNSA